VGELGKTLNQPKDLASAYRAAIALSAIGTAGLPPLLQFLTNRMVPVRMKRLALTCVGDMGTNARAAFPVLQRFLSSSDATIQDDAREALEMIDREALQKIPLGG
jgi:hypothetical protein